MAAMAHERLLREGHDLQLGVDCACYGDDEFVIAGRLGYEIRELRCFRPSSGPDMVGHVITTVARQSRECTERCGRDQRVWRTLRQYLRGAGQ
jgi:hypothetical protein